MMKKVLAVILAAMMLCMTGCGETSEEPINGALTFDELTDFMGYAEQQTQADTQTGDTLSFPANLILTNNGQLIDFMTAVTENRPVTYTNTLKEIGVGGVYETVTYTVQYDGTTAVITREANGEISGPVPIVQFGLGLLANACQDMTGNFDGQLYAQMIDSLDMNYWFEQYPYHMLYGINAVLAVTADGQYVVFDYYFDQSVSEQLALMGLGA